MVAEEFAAEGEAAPLRFEEEEVEAELAELASYRIVECSSDRRSNNRTEPSAPTEVKTSREEGDQATS